MNRRKILVVDDNPVVVKALSIKLQAGGFEVLSAEDGAGAVRMAREQRPDVIVLDINFPPDVAHGGGVPWDAFRIMDWLRRIEEVKHVPFIIITAGEPETFKARALAAGAVAFFQKPVSGEELLAAVRHSLGLTGPPSGPRT